MKRAVLTYRKEEKIAPYSEALRSVGIEPVMVTPDVAFDPLDMHGLVLTGGSDLGPALYGEERQPATDEQDSERDAMEFWLLSDALDRNLPVLAICRGMQLFNVRHAGTLVQHIEGHRVPLHDVTIGEGTQLAMIFGAGKHSVNSRHHQAVGRLGEGLIVSARAEDGVIEGLERRDRRFAVGVQWHPEDLMPQDRALFEAFGNSL